VNYLRLRHADYYSFINGKYFYIEFCILCKSSAIQYHFYFGMVNPKEFIIFNFFQYNCKFDSK